MNLREHIIRNATGFEEMARKIYDQWIQASTDKSILGQCLHPSDISGDTLQQKETYAWYYAISRVLEPKVIGEIGVRYGYTLYTLAKGSQVTQAYGYDNESYGVRMDWAREQIGSLCPVEIATTDSQKLTSLPHSGFDLLHVDGDHSSVGCYKDLCLAYEAVVPGGWILVDDIHGLYYQTEQDTQVKAGADRFLKEKGLKNWFLPTFRGMYLIQR